jgi:hypothetical protein
MSAARETSAANPTPASKTRLNADALGRLAGTGAAVAIRIVASADRSRHGRRITAPALAETNTGASARRSCSRPGASYRIEYTSAHHGRQEREQAVSRGWSRPVDPALALRNPAGYRARIDLMHADELLRHLRSLSHEQIGHHLRAVLPREALMPRGEVDVGIQFWSGAFDVGIRFGNSELSGGFQYRDGLPGAAHAAVLRASRELAREAGMVGPTFTIRFQNEPFSLAPLEGFFEVSRQLVATELAPRRFYVGYSPEHHERRTVDPAFITLFAHLMTDQEEPVSVELCSTTHSGYEERIAGWVRQRAAEWGVPFENAGPWLRKG